MKKFLLIVLACVFVIGGGVLLKKNKKALPAAQPTNHIYGDATTGVTIVEYGDFQCPGCGGFYPITTPLKEKYRKLVSFQFINFPLTSIHQNAQAAHRAAQAASDQGKFWEMYDLLYTNQNNWKDSTNAPKDFEAFAEQLKLDMTKYRTDFASAETNAIIAADITKGQQLKITGTPTFFIDGKRIDDNTSIATFDKFSKAVDDAIQAKTGKPVDKSKLNPVVTATETPSGQPSGAGDSPGASKQSQ